MGNRENARYVIWLLAALYLLYASFKIVRGYLRGDDVAVWMLFVVAVFVVLSIGIVVLALKGMKNLREEEARLAEEEQEQEFSEDELPEEIQEEKRPLSISERARLASNVQVPEGVVDEIADDGEDVE